MAGIASAGRPFDPNRRYPVKVAESLLNGTDGHGYVIVQVDQLPASTGDATITPSVYDEAECELTVRSGSGTKNSYTGARTSSAGHALVFDPSTQSLILDRIDASFAFVTSFDRQGSASPVSEEIAGASAAEDGSPDPENPFDWRHQLNRRRTSSPSPVEPFDPLRPDRRLSNSVSPPPAERGYRQASTPPDSQRPGSRSSTSSGASKPSSDGGLEIILDGAKERRGRPRHHFNTATDKAPRSLRSVTSSRVPSPAKQDDDASGGLEIILDGAIERPFRGRYLGPSSDRGPISLRSAASSRSPAVIRSAHSDEASDEDVDEMTLGSPAAATAAAAQPKRGLGEGRPQEGPDKDDEEEDEDEDEDEEEEEVAAAEEEEEDDDDDGLLADVEELQEAEGRASAVHYPANDSDEEMSEEE